MRFSIVFRFQFEAFHSRCVTPAAKRDHQARGGGHAVILDLDEEKAKQLGNADAYKVGCGDPANIRAVMAQVLKDHPKVDVEIHVAGIISRPRFQDVTDAAWEKVIHINLTVVFTMCSAIYPYFMEHGGGRIVNVASAAGKIGGKHPISCNEVCPSLTKTPMTSAPTEEMIPLGRAADPSEPAQMILFFANDAASFVNGEIGDCDGGIVLD